MQKSIRGVGVLQVVQDTRSPTDRVVNAAHDVVHVTPGHTITTTAFLWTKQNVGGKSRFKVKRKMSTLFFVRSHDLPEVAWRPAVHLRCPAASSRQHVGRTEGTASYPSMAADKSFGSARTRGLVRVRGAVICAHWPWWWGGWGGASCAPGAGAAPHRRRSRRSPCAGLDRRGGTDFNCRLKIVRQRSNGGLDK